MLLGYGAKVCLRKMRVKAENRMVTSKTLNWFFRCFSTNSNVNGYEVDNFPIPKLSSDIQSEISTLVKNIIRIKSSNCNADIFSMEKDIDKLVYQAYGLSIDDIKMIEQDY